jgi:peptidoglycan/xylan/chitin deacetylase (PgdA/CDA1 family)
MTSKRQRLAELLDGTGLVAAALRARAHLHLPWLTVLTYHRIIDPAAAPEMDPEVIDATPAELDAQLTLLGTHFRFVGLDDVIGWLDGRPLPPNPVLITFDDGYRECLSEALPILQRHQARAAFFVPTWYLRERRLFWWDRIAMLVHRSERARIELDYPRSLVLDRERDCEAALMRALTIVKTERRLDLWRFLEHLAEQSGVHVDPAEERAIVEQTLMTWSDVEKLVAAGMDVGSHTRTHRVLDTLSDEDLESELAGSRGELADVLGHASTSIAYPVGYPIEPRVRRALVRAGYRLGFTNQTGASWTGARVDPFAVRRMSMSRAQAHSMFRAFVALPPLAPRRLAPPPPP